MASPPPDISIHGYEPPVSLWGLVELYVPEHERGEIKSMLGEYLVEQSLELHEEVYTLLEIWRDYRDTAQQDTLKQPRLPEPPAARERLKQEIRFYVDSIKEKAKENGRDPDMILAKHNTNIISYALNENCHGGGDSRPGTARCRDGRETPLHPHTPDRMSLSSTVSDDVESMQAKLNYLEAEEVAQHLRETLEEEVNFLLEDIDFLQSCLDEEATLQMDTTTSREPSIADLRTERGKLEKDWLSKENVPEGLREMPKMPSSLRKLPDSPMHGNKNGKQLAHSPGSEKGMPMKASHNISTDSMHLHKDFTSLKSSSNLSNRSSSGVRRSRAPTTGSAGNPSHVTIKTSSLPNSANAKLVKVSMTPGGASDGTPTTDSTTFHKPTPPLSAKKPRPSSVNRFRKMVLQCRDSFDD